MLGGAWLFDFETGSDVAGRVDAVFFGRVGSDAIAVGREGADEGPFLMDSSSTFSVAISDLMSDFSDSKLDILDWSVAISLAGKGVSSSDDHLGCSCIRSIESMGGSTSLCSLACHTIV